MINDINFWIKKEKERQSKGFNLIASENICPLAVRKLEASILGNKYAIHPHSLCSNGVNG